MKNDEHLCTVGSDDVWMFSSGMWGEIWGPEASSLDVSGGSKRRPDGESDFLIWELPNELNIFDRITFFFEEGSESIPKGNIFDPEAIPPEEPKFNISFPPTEDDLTKLESRPALNIDVKWSVTVNGSQRFEMFPETSRQHIGLRLLWNEEKPQQLRVSISKKSLREITSRSDGEKIFLEYVPIGSTIDIQVGSNPAFKRDALKRAP
jgi:hypothetical protein